MPELSLKAILEAAIKIEEESYRLYTTAQEKVNYQSSKELLNELAEEELKHKEKLLVLMKNKANIPELESQTKSFQDLKIVDSMKDVTLTEDADYQTILVYAARREKSTHEYYKSLATVFEGMEVAELFSRLAKEELIHKNKIEREYDEYVLKENWTKSSAADLDL